MEDPVWRRGWFKNALGHRPASPSSLSQVKRSIDAGFGVYWITLKRTWKVTLLSILWHRSLA